MWLSSQCVLGWGPWIIDPLSLRALLMDHFLIFPLVWVPLDQTSMVLALRLSASWLSEDRLVCLIMASNGSCIPSHFPLCHGHTWCHTKADACYLLQCMCVFVCMCLRELFTVFVCLGYIGFVWSSTFIFISLVLLLINASVDKYKSVACKYMKEDKEAFIACFYVFSQV